MKRRLISGFVCVIGLLGLGEMNGHSPAYAAESAMPFLEGLGSHHYPVSTDIPNAQRYFDQGLVLTYGFNHAEAARSFREAQKLDPSCAMCFWGEALVLGPNINAPMEPSAVPQAVAAVEKALALDDQMTGKERALIQALATRYAKG